MRYSPLWASRISRSAWNNAGSSVSASGPPSAFFSSSAKVSRKSACSSVRGACRPAGSSVSGREGPFQYCFPRPLSPIVLFPSAAPAAGTAPAAPSAAAEPAPLALRSRFINGERTVHERRAVEAGNRLVGVLVRGHLNEAEPLGTAGR